MLALSSFPIGSPGSNNVILKCAFVQNKFNFTHINLGTFRRHKFEIESTFRNASLSALAVSETWLNELINNKIVNIDGYNLFRHDRSRADVSRGGGVAIFVRKGLKARIVVRSRKNAVTEFLFLEITNNIRQKIAFGVVYNPPRKNKFDSLCNSLVKLTQQYSEIMVLGDFNLNPNDADVHSVALSNTLVSNGLALVSREPTNFSSLSNPSLIDQCYTSDPARVVRFSQLSLGSLSTHDLIFGTFDFATFPCQDTVYHTYRDFNSASIEQLESLAVSLYWNALYSLADIDDQANYFTQLLQTTIEQAVPLITLRIDSRTAKPINVELENLILKRNFFNSCARHEKNLLQKAIFHVQYKKARNKVTALRMRLERRFLLKELSSSLPAKCLWRNLKRHGVINHTSAIKIHFPQPSSMTTSPRCSLQALI